MNENKVFRANARAQLGGSIFSNNWLMALVVCLIASAILGVVNSLAGIGSLLLDAFFVYGMAHVFLQIIRSQRENVEIGDLFKGTEHAGDLILLSVLTWVFTFLWSLLFIIPGIVKAYAYSMAPYIKYDHPDYDWRKCLDESQRMMKGNKWQLFCLHFSFIGWYIVGMLCCGIGTLWVVPYQKAAEANFYENLKAIYDPAIEIPVEEPVAESTSETAPETDTQSETDTETI